MDRPEISSRWRSNSVCFLDTGLVVVSKDMIELFLAKPLAYDASEKRGSADDVYGEAAISSE